MSKRETLDVLVDEAQRRVDEASVALRDALSEQTAKAGAVQSAAQRLNAHETQTRTVRAKARNASALRAADLAADDAWAQRRAHERETFVKECTSAEAALTAATNAVAGAQATLALAQAEKRAFEKHQLAQKAQEARMHERKAEDETS